jgi:hypothetical protein
MHYLNAKSDLEIGRVNKPQRRECFVKFRFLKGMNTFKFSSILIYFQVLQSNNER